MNLRILKSSWPERESLTPMSRIPFVASFSRGDEMDTTYPSAIMMPLANVSYVSYTPQLPLPIGVPSAAKRGMVILVESGLVCSRERLSTSNITLLEGHLFEYLTTIDKSKSPVAISVESSGTGLKEYSQFWGMPSLLMSANSEYTVGVSFPHDVVRIQSKIHPIRHRSDDIRVDLL